MRGYPPLKRIIDLKTFNIKTIFFIVDSFFTIKIRMFAKTKAQKVKICLSFERFFGDSI